jgi:hypothetical protein
MRLYGEWLAEGQINTSGQYRPDAESLRKNAVLGPPERVAELLKKVIASTPMTELSLMMQFPGLDPNRTMKSVRRFTEEVLPSLR